MSKEENPCLKNIDEMISIFDNYMDIILIVNENGRIIDGNKKAVDTYGYTYKELLELNVFDLRNGDVKHINKQLDEAMKKGIVFKTFHYKKDGSKFPVEVKSMCGSNIYKGKVVSIVKDISDIDKLTNYATMFSASLDIFDEAIVGFTKELKISIWSKGAEKRFGYTSEEMIGQQSNLLIPKDRLIEFRNIIETVARGEVIDNKETVRIKKDGNVIDVLLSISPLYDCDGFFMGGLGIYKDISEKKELTKKLQESEERWRFALEGGKFGVWDLDLDTKRLVHYNNWKEVLGYKIDEIDDYCDTWAKLIHPDDIEEVKIAFNKCFEGNDYIAEYRIKSKNNKYRWIRSKGRISAWKENGQPLRIVGTSEDITDSKFIEKELSERYKQLGFLRQEAEGIFKAKSQFLANISHEMRTPNGILELTGLVQSNNPDIFE